jgi:diguanylate cyclase (GGDEF)-like protein
VLEGEVSGEKHGTYGEELERLQGELSRLQVQLHEANDRLKRMAIVDPLTELLNRLGLEYVLGREMKWVRQGEHLLVLRLNLDDFGSINRSFGYSVGDILLREVAHKLRGVARGTDYVARIGGDEFLLLMPRTRLGEGMRLAEKVRLAVCGEPFVLAQGKDVQVTASFGLVEVLPDASSSEDLLSETHSVVRLSKEGGKNRVSYSAALVEGRPHLRRENGQVADLLKRGDCFTVVRQPIVRLKDERDVGYEFFSRSTVEVFELPFDFFRVSLEADILTAVDRRCFSNCLRASAAVAPPLWKHVNLFPSTMIDVPIDSLIASFPDGNGGHGGGGYCLEISEQQIIGDPAYLVEPVRALKKAGIRVAVDDVGFGRSCLESLILLEPQVVKIDRSCVQGISRNGGRLQVMERLLRMTQSLDCEVVAEGVESREDLAVLRQLGISYGQGYLWGTPA